MKRKPEKFPTTDRIANASVSHLDEFYDGYVLLAITAGENRPVVISKMKPGVVSLAMQAHVSNYVSGAYTPEKE